MQTPEYAQLRANRDLLTWTGTGTPTLPATAETEQEAEVEQWHTAAL